MVEGAAARAFEAFNARFLTAEEVARTFIPPSQYARLVETSHSVLLGPRGSGKTTLLKMLQLRSLAAWGHEDADRVREKLGFHAIFLGTDVLWGAQLESRTAPIENEEKRGNIRRTSFRLHLAIAFLNALNECRDPQLMVHPQLKRFTCPFDRIVEASLAESLAAIWKIDLPSNSLLGLRVALRAQLSELLAVTARLRSDGAEPLPDFVFIDPVASIISAIDITNEVLSQPERRWAILCDELEIAPDMVRRELFQLLRSTDHKIIFKFSLFPYSSELASLIGPESPTVNNDYTPLDLTYGKRESAYAFCQSLLSGMIREAGGTPPGLPEDVLGEGWFDGGRAHRRAKVSPYAPPNGPFYLRAERLRKNDSSFRAWLQRQKINLREVHQMEDSAQAPFRKALPFILTRSEFVRPGGNLRSRKAITLYTGAYSLFSLTEGNPRVFINLMRPLVEEHVRVGGTVNVELQASSADVTIHRFKASLSAIPSSGDGDIVSVLHLLEILGNYFLNAQLTEGFSPEPPTTFIVDSISTDIFELVGRALNAGALVRMSDDTSEGVTEINKARLRLAYTLAPDFKIPLVSGRTANLSTIITAYRNAKRRNPAAATQAFLPFGVDE